MMSTLSLIVSSGQLTLGNLPGAIRHGCLGQRDDRACGAKMFDLFSPPRASDPNG
jgi:hypothetical protein